ncbi:MAG: immunoglobulin-like domain-containing protein [Eubacteriales bacterium]
MKKILSLSLILIMVMALVGCNSNTTAISELWEMPEPPYPLKVAEYGSLEVKEFYVGSEEYEIGDSSIRTVLEWSSSLELKEVSFDKGEHPSESDGWSSYEFIVADKIAFSYADFGEKGYVIVDDIWYEVQNPSLPNFNELETYSLAEPKDWGITFTASDVTPTGLTIICEQADGEQQGELMTGSPYWLQVYENNRWEKVEYIPQEYDVGWTSDGWSVNLDGTTQWKVDWEWLYGKLPSGTYRIGKSIMDWVEAGNYEEQTYYAEFEIE